MYGYNPKSEIYTNHARRTDMRMYLGPSNRLTRHLLKQHERSAPPDGVVNITHEMELVHIINVDEVKQTMRVLVYVVE
ncbi:hypothetical protein ANCDUO_26288, partial [Ancylostoma duodenale]